LFESLFHSVECRKQQRFEFQSALVNLEPLDKEDDRARGSIRFETKDGFEEVNQRWSAEPGTA
jgi:hypothetical protein